MNYRIFPPDDLLQTELTIPESKSVANRRKIISALAGTPEPHTDDAPDDIAALDRALHTPLDGPTTIDVGPAGTAMRFLAAYFAASPGADVTLTGSTRMNTRPIAPLVDALRACGAQITYTDSDGCAPLHIVGTTLRGGTVEINATVSSQFISAILMVAPYMVDGLTLTLTGESVSAPYIDLTISMMQQAGAQVDRSGATITVSSGAYTHPIDTTEGDWSAAAFWFEIEALTSGFVTIHGLKPDAHQPDVRLMRLFQPLGVAAEWSDDDPDTLELLASPDQMPRLDVDLTDNPDLAQPLAVACAMIGMPFHITGLSTLPVKETDRIAALAEELLKVGVRLSLDEPHAIAWDGYRYPIREIPEFDTYADHRMAMAFAPIALYIPGIVIRNPEVVTKSYPRYWADLAAAGFRIFDADQPIPQGEEASDE